MRTFGLAALLSLALLVPAAQAKEGIERLRVCGASGCRTINSAAEIAPLIAATHTAGVRTRAPVSGAYYTFVPVPTRGWPSSWPRLIYVPSTKSLRVRQSRESVSDLYRLTWAVRYYRAVTRKLQPFPRPSG